MTERNKPVIISIVSGKGGCGKTRIATALARLLSEKSNVLLVDMDLHNQGLTTLLNKNVSDTNYTVYDTLNLKSDIYKNSEIIKINEKVFFLPSINQNVKVESNLMEIEKNFTPEIIKSKLDVLINYLIMHYPIDFVIFDNTGLPDAFSIGSSLCSNKVLIITQPENVSWKGALNFYTIFKVNKGDVEKISFIVNNVPKKYTFSTISDLFGFDFNFLAFIPFEYGIMESFGKNPFDDELLPTTQFYRKIGYIAANILEKMERKDLISEEMIKYNTDSIKEDLTEKYTTSSSYKELRFKYLRGLSLGLLIMTLGVLILLYGVGIYRFQIEDIYKIIGFLISAYGAYYYFVSATEFFKLKRKSPPH